MRCVPPNSLYRLSSPEALWLAWQRYARGKGRRPSVAAFSLDVDRHIFALHRSLRDGSWRPGDYYQQVVRDPKPRLISAPSISDRVLHEAILAEIGAYFTRSFIEHSYASQPGRGVERAALRYLRCVRRYRWRLSLDVQRFFPSVRHDVLLSLLARRVRDADTLALLTAIVRSGEGVYSTGAARELMGVPVPACGLPIGSAFSQWAANVLLDGVDHFVQRRLRPGAYQRYMDDLTLFSDDYARLTEAHAVVSEWLASSRGLTLHSAEVVLAKQPSVYLGFRVSSAGLSASKKQRTRARVGVVQAAKAGHLYPALLAYRARAMWP